MQACEGRGKKQAVRRGDTVNLPNQPVKHVFLLLDGLIAAFRTTESGYDNLAVLMLPGDFWGLGSLFDNDRVKFFFDTEGAGEYGYWSRAVVPSVFCKVTGIQFQAFMDRDHGLAERVMRRQLALLENQVRLHSFSAQGQGLLRLIALLLIIAERVGKPMPSGLAIPFELRHEDLAELTCLSRPVVTRNLLELRRLEMIEINDSVICLRDIPALVRALRR